MGPPLEAHARVHLVHSPPEFSESEYADIFLRHTLYIATKFSGKSSNSPSASLRAKQLLKLRKSHSGGLLGSLGRFNRFTPCHSLEACFRYFCVHYGGWEAVACCPSS